MEGLVNYSSEEEREESPKRNVAECCPVSAIDHYKRSKGDSSRRPKEENLRGCADEKAQCSSHRDIAHNSFRKNSHNEDSAWNRFNSSSRDSYHRSDRRQVKSYDKKRDTKDDRKRRDMHRDRVYDHRDVDRDRRDRSDRYRRDRHDRERQRKSLDSPPPTNKDRNAANNRSRNRSKSRSASKEYPSNNKTNVSMHTTKAMFADSRPSKMEHKPVNTTNLLPQSNITPNLQAAVSIPLKEEAPKMLKTGSTSESVAISLPKYYNPNIINPSKYAEQVQKRKLIWGSKKSEDTAAKWGHATFSEDSDGKVASKFMRLMGIKPTPKVGATAADASNEEKTGPDVKSRQAMFSNMEQQYEVARQVTHTMRGVGLGFGSQSRQY